ncbi:hypothetical protein BKA93DRAFT_922371, partial [Sparassis latifolia]
ADPVSDTVIWHDVRVVTTHIEFLRVRVNDPNHQYEKLRDINLSFDLPNLSLRLPLTVLRRIFTQCLISRIRPHLAFQPVTHQQAVELEHLITLRVHQYFSFPFRFNSQLLTLPLRHYGFDFPSLSCLNDSAAVTGLLRDLNHHHTTFRNGPHLSTLLSKSCVLLNHCVPPLDSLPTPRLFTHHTRNLPSSWITAHTVLCRLQLVLRHTDQSFFFSGDVSLRHLL